MIEYALLFALGFLGAAVIALAIAPAIHRRIVAYTERRLYATMPISPEEVRAQKDMERAAFAAEAARLGQDVRREREGRLKAEAQAEAMGAEATHLTGELAELRHHIEDMNTATADLRAEIRRATLHNTDLKAALNLSQTTIDALRREMDLHMERERRLETDISNYRIEIAARESENENLSMRLQAIRHERDTLRQDYRQTTGNLTDLERRSSQSESRLARLEQKMLRQAADLADMENRLERRNREVEQLRERLRAAQRQKEALRMAASTGETASEEEQMEKPGTESTPRRETASDEPLKERGKALMAKVLATGKGGDDAELREEIADLAAAMAAHAGGGGKTAERIRDILIASPPPAGAARLTLANRIASALRERGIASR